MRDHAARLTREVIEGARASGRDIVIEPEGYDLVQAMGIAVPRHVFVKDPDEAAQVDLGTFTGKRVVVKVISHRVLHRSDVGGVVFVARETDAVAGAVRDLERRFAGQDVSGYTVNQFIKHEVSLGGELLIGARWTDDFGPIATLGPGGIYAEFLSANLRRGREIAILSPGITPPSLIAQVLETKALAPLITGRLRGQPPLIAMESLVDLVARLMEFAAATMPRDLAEFEINPLVLTAGGPVALDVLARLGRPPAAAAPPRPIGKLKNLLEPRSVGIIGVSGKINPGRMIVKNMIREGYEPSRIHVVKPGRDAIEGCRCYPDIASLPGVMDLFILSVDAAQVPDLVEEIAAARKAESLIVIPGGMSERSGGDVIERRVRATLEAARATRWGGPVLNGGNCLGIRSKPGGYDTMFIPSSKLPGRSGKVAPVAFVSQSGAFAAARVSKIDTINPRYAISLGNQTDLTVADYLDHLQDDPHVRVFACYVEGFRPLDGRRFVDAAARIAESGRVVILYRAGRTPAGAAATSSHTASIAGDYAVTRELAGTAGVVVASSLADFEDLVRLFCFLENRPVTGWGLGALSNAGFECVAMADGIGRFRIGPFGDQTAARLRDLFDRCRLSGIVDVHNPLDVTPIMNDGAFEEAVRAVMDDPGVDVAVIGCVPLTGALNTLPASAGTREDLAGDDAIAGRLIRIRRECPKPWVAVVDAGSQYDPLVRMLDSGDIPTFRTADRAMRMLEVFCFNRLHPRRSVIEAYRDHPALVGTR